MIANETKDYICIECGSPVKNLYKKYSETVLKLTKCETCNHTADKYVEYDSAIIVIDLILLRVMAYRHFLLNSDLKNFWKLSIVLLLLETYSNWTVTTRDMSVKEDINDTKPYLAESNIYLEDFKFYKMFLFISIDMLCFATSIYVCTVVYTVLKKRSWISFIMVCKAVTLSSAGLLLFLPSLIWDITVYDLHLHFISLYTTLSQLLAYKALCNCEKIWSLFVIFSSILVKTCIGNYLSSLRMSIYST